MSDDKKSDSSNASKLSSSSNAGDKSTASDTGAPSPSASKPKSSDTSSASPEPGGSGGKSARESVGGSSAVHYGFFSNVKTPEYKSGWDDIWGKTKMSASSRKPTKNLPRQKQNTQKKTKKITVSLDLHDLPEEIQLGLTEAARTKLKKLRVNYDNRAKVGAVTWKVVCNVERR